MFWCFSTTFVKTAITRIYWSFYIIVQIYLPAIRRFQRYKAMDANTVIVRTEPTMTYHCTVGLAEKNKKQKGN